MCVLHQYQSPLDISEACIVRAFECLLVVYHPIFQLGHLLAAEESEVGLGASEHVHLTSSKDVVLDLDQDLT